MRFNQTIKNLNRIRQIIQVLVKYGFEDMVTSSYAAPHTGTPMFSMRLKVEIPADISISRLREEFFEFCDELNLDAVIEPFKG